MECDEASVVVHRMDEERWRSFNRRRGGQRVSASWSGFDGRKTWNQRLKTSIVDIIRWFTQTPKKAFGPLGFRTGFRLRF